MVSSGFWLEGRLDTSMSLYINTQGRLKLLKQMLENTDEAKILRLYQNNWTPTEGDTVATYTTCTWGGYADVTLVAGSWNQAVGNGLIATCSYGSSPIAWTASTTGTAYGYLVFGASSGVLYWSEQFPVARSYQIGDIEEFTPTMSYGNITPA